MAPRKKTDITPDSAKKQSNNVDLNKKIDLASLSSSTATYNNKTIYSESFDKLSKEIYNIRNDNSISSNSVLAAVNTGVLNIKDYIKTNFPNDKIDSIEKITSEMAELLRDIPDEKIIESLKEVNDSMIKKEDIDTSLNTMSQDISDKLVSQNQLQIDNYNNMIELLNITNCNNGALSQKLDHINDEVDYLYDSTANTNIYMNSIANNIIDIQSFIDKNMQSQKTELTTYFKKFSLNIHIIEAVASISVLLNLILAAMLLR